ncbi:DNA transposase [Frankliniella fusca]|uniref:DNA transposase n=1 Tax=Frankliniella fusca TaxID=407009 RepID=A0AAE1LV57_9NEOP|nr:DNA transposase [Frankliniella fusca]
MEMEKFPVSLQPGPASSPDKSNKRTSLLTDGPEVKRRKQTFSEPSCSVPSTPPPFAGTSLLSPFTLHITPPSLSTPKAVSQASSVPLNKTTQKRVTHISVAKEAGIKAKILTPGKKKLIEMVKKKHQIASAFKRRYQYSLKKAKIAAALAGKESAGNARFIGNLNISMGARVILNGEIKNHGKSLNNRRWTVKEKCWALALYKRSARAYKWLRRSVTLPGEKALKSILTKIKLEPGVSPFLLKVLQQKLLNRDAESETVKQGARLVTVAFDEMFINEEVYYDTVTDQIRGVEDYGDKGRTSELANHVLVFMVQGAVEDLKFPVGYYPVHSTCPSDTLAILVPSVIRDLQGIGLTVLATISDQGPTNRGAVTILRGSSDQGQYDNVYTVNGERIVHLWDTPHLLKSIRNNILTSDLEFGQGKVAQWRHVIEFYKMDEGICKTSSLTYAHMCPAGKNKMRVKLAAQVLSEKVSSAMFTFTHLTGDRLAHWNQTAQLIKEVDELFDSMNGPGRKDKQKARRNNVNNNSYHMQYWREMRQKLTEWVFIRKETPDSPGGVRHIPPCVEGLQANLISYGRLWNKLKNIGIDTMKLRNFNQDKLENYFCLIRQSCGDNTDPTLPQFVAGMKTALVMEVSKGASGSAVGNCEDDDTAFVADLADLIAMSATEAEDTPEPVLLRANLPATQKPVPNGKIARQGPTLTCVEICSAVLQTVKECQTCHSVLTTSDSSSDTALQMMREEMSCQDKPSPHLINSFLMSQKAIVACWKELQSKKKITDSVIEKLQDLDALGWVKCPTHQDQVKSLLRSLFATFLIRQQCKQVNQEIKESRKRVTRQILRAKGKNVPADFGLEEIHTDDWRLLTGLQAVNKSAAVILQDTNPLLSSTELLRAAIQSTSEPVPPNVAAIPVASASIEKGGLADEMALLEQFEAATSGGADKVIACSSNETLTLHTIPVVIPSEPHLNQNIQTSLDVIRNGKANDLTVVKLKDVLRFWKIGGYSSLKKNDLVALVQHKFQEIQNKAQN